MRAIFSWDEDMILSASPSLELLLYRKKSRLSSSFLFRVLAHGQIVFESCLNTSWDDETCFHSPLFVFTDEAMYFYAPGGWKAQKKSGT